MKYIMKTRTEKPTFKYLIRAEDCFDYYLYNSLRKALQKACSLSINRYSTDYYIHEIKYISYTSEYRSIVRYTCDNGKADYDVFALPDNHIYFYVNAGEWLNPNENLSEVEDETERL